MIERPPRTDEPLTGEHLALDLVNTLYATGDHLATLPGLHHWLTLESPRFAPTLPPEPAAHLAEPDARLTEANTHPSDTGARPTETDARPSETDAHPSQTDAQLTEAGARSSGDDVRLTEDDARPSGTDAHLTETGARPSGGDARRPETGTHPTDADAHPSGRKATLTEADARRSGTDTHPTDTDAHPSRGDASLTEGDAEMIRGLRAHVATTLAHLRQGVPPPVQSLAAITEAQRATPSRTTLTWADGHLTATTHRQGTLGARLAAQLADAAVDLLTGDVTRIRQCEGHDCVMLFIPAHPRRRWCSTTTCGNRARVARHYARHKPT